MMERKCSFWPSDEDLRTGNFGGVCDAGSEIGGTGFCSEEDEKVCGAAEDYRRIESLKREG